jgi:hypothetical protein
MAPETSIVQISPLIAHGDNLKITTRMRLYRMSVSTMKLKKKASLLALAVAAAFSTAPVVANTLTFQGVTFETFAVDASTLQLTSLNADAAMVNWAGVNYLDAFKIKGITTSGVVTGATITSGPNIYGANVVNGLSARSLGCGAGGALGACFAGTPVAFTSPMTSNISFTASGPLDFSQPELKVEFLTYLAQTHPTRNLLSRTTPVRESETYAMLLAGLGIMGFVSMRRHRARRL